MGRFVGKGVPDNEPNRLDRILDAKYRLIGVDVQALDEQVRQKAGVDAAQRAEDSAHAEIAKEHSAILSLAAAEAASTRAEWDRQVQAFRSKAQGKETRREWDLSRPDALLRDTPARVDDDDPRCGPSSLQKFTGEDLTAGQRTAAQMEQARAWWDAQAAEHAARAAVAAADKAAHARLVADMDGAQRDVAAAEAAARRRAREEATAANAALMGERAARRAEASAAEAAAKESEVQSTAASPWLNEDPQLGASAISSTRVRRDHWKGMSREQQAAVRAEQLKQVEAAREAGQAKAAEEARAAAMQREIASAMAQQALGAAQARRRQAEAAAEALKVQIAEKTSRDSTTRETYSNRVEPSYFQQFGTSHR